jgi:hypothetical protein
MSAFLTPSRSAFISDHISPASTSYASSSVSLSPMKSAQGDPLQVGVTASVGGRAPDALMEPSSGTGESDGFLGDAREPRKQREGRGA